MQTNERTSPQIQNEQLNVMVNRLGRDNAYTKKQRYLFRPTLLADTITHLSTIEHMVFYIRCDYNSNC